MWLVSTLMQSRLFERDIHMERFLTAADGSSATRLALFKRFDWQTTRFSDGRCVGRILESTLARSARARKPFGLRPWRPNVGFRIHLPLCFN